MDTVQEKNHHSLCKSSLDFDFQYQYRPRKKDEIEKQRERRIKRTVLLVEVQSNQIYLPEGRRRAGGISFEAATLFS